MAVLFSVTDRFYLIFSVLLFFASSLLLLKNQRINSEPTQDKQALLAFISQIPHENRLQWNRSDSACNWVGVKCDPNQSYVSTLRLPGVGLVGPIPPNTLGNLTQLRVLSLRSNPLTGQLPSDFSNLKFLRSLPTRQPIFRRVPTNSTRINSANSFRSLHQQLYRQNSILRQQSHPLNRTITGKQQSEGERDSRREIGREGLCEVGGRIAVATSFSVFDMLGQIGPLILN